ncbi:MAG: YihY/virulence factor BrkB family protein [Actinomycetota bacterium]
MSDAEPNDHAPQDRPSMLERERLRASRWEHTIEDRMRPRLAATAERRPKLWHRLLAPSLTVAVRVSRDALGIQAGSLTYGAFLSLPPLLLILMSVAGALLRSHPQASEDLVLTVTNVVPGLDQVINANVELRSVQQLGVGLVGVGAVIWAASGFAARTRHAFGVVFRTERTGLVAGRISAALLGTPIILLFVVLAVAGSLSAGVRPGDLPWVAEAVGLASVALVSFLFVLMTYRLLTPGHGPTLRRHVPGAVVFALGWTVLHLLGATYVSYVITRTTALYGAVGAIFGVLAFIYLTMWLLLLGAEVSQAYRSTAVGVAEAAGLSPGREPR